MSYGQLSAFVGPVSEVSSHGEVSVPHFRPKIEQVPLTRPVQHSVFMPQSPNHDTYHSSMQSPSVLHPK